MRKKSLIIKVSNIVLLTSIFSAIAVSATSESQLKGQKQEIQNSIEEKKQNIEAIEKELSNTKDQRKEKELELAKLNIEIEDLNNNIKSVEDDINSKVKEIEDTEEEISETESKIEENYDILSDVIKISYEQQSGGYLQLLLEATSISNFIRRLEILTSISKQNDEIINETTKLQEELEEKKTKLEEDKTEMQEKKNILVEEKSKVDKLADEQQKKVDELIGIQNNLKEKIELNNDQIEALEKESANITNKINALTSSNNNNSNSGNNSSSGGGNNPSYQGGKFAWPVPSTHSISSSYGYRIHPITGNKKLHAGIDIPGQAGDTVVAAESGTVIVAEYSSSYGNYVIIDHGSGLTTLYAHNTSLNVRAGQKVQRGQQIARVGTTGLSTGNHLHFEVRVNGSTVDPMGYLR